jgi:hypothetical protein
MIPGGILRVPGSCVKNELHPTHEGGIDTVTQRMVYCGLVS